MFRRSCTRLYYTTSKFSRLSPIDIRPTPRRLEWSLPQLDLGLRGQPAFSLTVILAYVL